MDSQYCLLHQWWVWPKPATIDRGSKVSETPDPINSTEAPQPTAERGAISSLPPTPRCSTRSTKGVPPVRYTPSRKWMDYSEVLCVQVVQWRIGLLVLSLSNKRVWTCETWTMWNILLTFSVFKILLWWHLIQYIELANLNNSLISNKGGWYRMR